MNLNEPNTTEKDQQQNHYLVNEIPLLWRGVFPFGINDFFK